MDFTNSRNSWTVGALRCMHFPVPPAKISGRKMSWLSWDTKIAKHYFLKLKMFKLNIQMLSSIESHDIKKLQLKIFCRVSIIHIHTYEWTATSTLHAFSSGCRNEVLKNLMDFSRDVLSQSVTQRVEQRGCLRQGCMVLKCYIFFWQLQIMESDAYHLLFSESVWKPAALSSPKSCIK